MTSLELRWVQGMCWMTSPELRWVQGMCWMTSPELRWVQVGAAVTGRGLEAVRNHAEAHRDLCRVVSANWLLDCDEQRCLVSPLAGEHLLTPLHTASLTSLRQVAASRSCAPL